jgi:hypothetical protein
VERGDQWKLCQEISEAGRVLPLFPFHREIISRTYSRASAFDDSYSTFDETPLSPLPPHYESDPAPIDLDETTIPLKTIATSLNLQAASNKKRPYPTSREDRINFTVSEMNNAEGSQDIDTWQEFLQEVCRFYSGDICICLTLIHSLIHSM